MKLNLLYLIGWMFGAFLLAPIILLDFETFIINSILVLIGLLVSLILSYHDEVSK